MIIAIIIGIMIVYEVADAYFGEHGDGEENEDLR